jgi:hypothetical protein
VEPVSAIVGFVGPILGKKVAIAFIDENFSGAEAEKLKTLLGFDTGKLAAQVDEILGKVNVIAEIVKDIQFDVNYANYRNLFTRFRTRIVTYDDAYNQFDKARIAYEAASERSKAPGADAAAAAATASTLKVALERYGSLSSACLGILDPREGLCFTVRAMIQDLLNTNRSGNKSMFELVNDAQTREFTDAFTHSDRIRYIFEHVIKTAAVAIRLYQDAIAILGDVPTYQIDVQLDSGSEAIRSLLDHYKKVASRVNRLAAGLRQWAQTTPPTGVLLRWAVEDQDDNLFLTGCENGAQKTTAINVVKDDRSEGYPIYTSAVYDNSQPSKAFPQIFAAPVGKGLVLKISLQARWTIDEFDLVLDTKSQLWRVGIVKEEQQEYLTLRHERSGLYLAAHEDGAAYLGPNPAFSRWLPILSKAEVGGPCRGDDDVPTIILRNAHNKKRVLQRTTQRVLVEADPSYENPFIRWQLIPEAVVPSGTGLKPGEQIRSTNGAYSLGHETRDIGLGETAGSVKVRYRDPQNPAEEIVVTELAESSFHTWKNHPGSYVRLGNDGHIRFFDVTGKLLIDIAPSVRNH